MGLKTVKPSVAMAPSAVAWMPQDRKERDRHRDAQPWRSWYKLARWVKLRAKVLLRDMYTCQWQGCGRIEHNTSKLVADHKIPHRGDETLFWDEDNIWTLCQHCHDSAKQAEERSGRLG